MIRNIFYIGALLLTCCTQKESIKIPEMDRITQEIEQYYNSGDIQHLYNTKEYIDSVENEENSYYFFDTRIQIYVLLDEYEEAISYIENIDASKFNKSYQKQFYLYCLKAMQATFNNDSILSKEYYGKTIGLLQNQVNLEYDETAFYELYLMKSKINPCALVEKELDSIINEDGQYREIANILRSSIGHLSSGESVAIERVLK